MRCSFKVGIFLGLCFFSFNYANVLGDVRICALRVEFEEDSDESTSGTGQFLLENEGIDCDSYTIDSPPHNRSYFESQLEALDAYYSDVSYDKFGIDLENSFVFPSGETDAYSVPNSMNYYHPYNQDDIEQQRLTELFHHAIQVAYDTDEVNFSNFDLIVVFHAGIGQDFSLPFLDPTPEDIPSTFVDSKMILEHLGSSSISVGNHQIDKGILLPETQNHLLYDLAESMFSSASNPCDYQYALTGTFAMLTGFALGLPPLWNIDTGESGVGIFGLMDQGSNNNRGIMPAPPTAYTRIFAGWELPTISSFGDFVSLQKRSENQLMKIPINDDEYFLIENRNNTIHNGVNLDSMRHAMYEASGKTNYPSLVEVLFDSTGLIQDENGVIISVPNYDVGLPASGLLIWHIDESVIQSGLDDYSVNKNLSRLGVDLEEADGAQDIGYQSIHIFNDPSAGYFGDMWFKGNTQYELANPSMEGLPPAFGPNTYPNTNSHDGSASFIIVDQISSSGDTMTFSIINSLIKQNYPISEGTLINTFLTENGEMILGSDDSLWIAPIDTPSQRISFYEWNENSEKFVNINAQNEHTLFNIFEFVYEDSQALWKHFRFDYYHPNQSIIKTFEILKSVGSNYVPIMYDSLSFITRDAWETHSKQVFTPSYNFGIDLSISGISVTDFNGTITKWNNLSFESIAGIDLDNDASIDVLALDSSGILYAFNSELMLMSGFPTDFKIQSPVLARDLVGDNHPEIVAKSADSSSIYILNNQGNILYKITTSKKDEIISIKPIDGKNSIFTQNIIYQFDDESESFGNEWLFTHGDFGKSRTIDIKYQFENPNDHHLVRAYCYPNPIQDDFGTIRIESVEADQIIINLFDLSGHFIKNWKTDLNLSGNQITEKTWSVTDVESGVYFAHVTVESNKGTESSIIKIAVIH